jgi:hypothetical protein
MLMTSDRFSQLAAGLHDLTQAIAGEPMDARVARWRQLPA